MPKFAANLTMLFTDIPFLERFTRAKQHGFTHVEYLFPYPFEANELKAQLDANRLQQVLFNLPAGDWAAGDRGIGAHPNKVMDFQAGIPVAIEYAKVLGVKRLNLLAGKRVEMYSDSEHWNTLVENARFAASALKLEGITLVVEAINHFDIPTFFLNRTEQVAKLVEDIAMPNVLIQYDVYHAQREEGELAATLRKYASKIGHIQVADNPGRHEPGTGEINYDFIFKEIDGVGYQGYVGLEYIQTPGLSAPFKWIEDFGY